MPSSATTLAKRSLVSLILKLAVAYQAAVSVSRDSPDARVLASYRKLILKVHPDKGGRLQDMQDLQSAKDKWDEARKGCKPGRPQKDHNAGGRRQKNTEICPKDLTDPDQAKKQYRICSSFVLLTFHGIVDIAHWESFVKHVKDQRQRWGWKHWCATLETSKKGGLHIHCALQFKSQTDRSSRFFAFDGLYPRADLHDPLGQGINKKEMQTSINRIMFYCFADKIGTVFDSDAKACTDGNYFPAWVNGPCFSYVVDWHWPHSLFKAYKLSLDVYESYIYLCREGVLPKIRNLQAVREREKVLQEAQEMKEVTKRIRSTYSFPQIPEVTAWLSKFEVEKDRYPFLVLLAPSYTGKTEYANSLFKHPLEIKIGSLQHFPDGLRQFDRSKHDAIIMDDVRDMSFIVQHQDKLQGKPHVRIEFASTPGGQCCFSLWLWKIPLVFTANLSTSGLALLETDDFLGNERNRVVVRYQGQASSSALRSSV